MAWMMKRQLYGLFLPQVRIEVLRESVVLWWCLIDRRWHEEGLTGRLVYG
jgi:hypothetical protein